MSEQADTSYQSEFFAEEEDAASEIPIPCYGHEPGYKYSGEPMDEDQVAAEDESEGNFVCPPNFMLNRRYQVKTLIGRGTFCLVWLAFDHVWQRNVAIKILKRTQENVCDDELTLNQHLSEGMGPDVKVIKFYSMFYHLDHACLVFELAAHNILTFINYLDAAYVGLPFPLIKKIVKDTLLGLDYMHKRGVIHTDLKLENVMASRPLFPYKPFVGDDSEVFNCLEDDPNTISFKLGDVGNSCFVNHPVNDLIQTRQYRSPEVLLGLPYDTSADIWSLGCMAFELATKNYLFNPEYSDSATETSQTRPNFDALHLSMIEQVIGVIPKDWAREGSQYRQLYEDDELIERCPDDLPDIYEQLIRRQIPDPEAGDLAEFIRPMLRIIPAQRPSAEELLQSPWLHQI